jgi:hypothetical protein
MEIRLLGVVRLQRAGILLAEIGPFSGRPCVTVSPEDVASMEESSMKTVISALVAVAGIAAAANAASSITAQVWNGSSWGSTAQVNPAIDGTVLVRYVVSTDNANAAALNGANFQPTVSNWAALDAAVLGATSGNFSVAADSSFETGNQFGRVAAFAFPNISAANTLKAHIAGSTLRIAQQTVTNAPGAGVTFNNVNGSGGIPISQNIGGPGRPVGSPDVVSGTSVIVYGFRINLNSDNSNRNLGDVTKDLTLSGRSFSTGGATRWFTPSELAAGSSTASINEGPASFNDAFIDIVPTPASLALIGLGGVVAGRRRR